MQENQLDDALRTGCVFLEEQTSNARRFGVIKRILNHTKKQLARNETIEFSWQDIAELNDHENEGKTLKKLISEVITELDAQYSALNKIAIGNECSFLPKLKQTEKGGGAGNPNKYKITAHSVDLEPLDIEIPHGHIRYSLEKIASPNFLACWINNYVAQGLKFKLLVGGMSSVIIFGLLITFLGLYSLHQAETLLALVKVIIGFGSLLISIYYFASPLYQCLMKRIVSAPVMLTPGDIRTAQLEYVPTGDKDKNERSIREFRIVSYSASCLICEGKIELEEGVGSMKGRLVGSCTESPREHLYTFDHKTKSGRAVFEEYANWPS
jgi:hypothetical protein